MKISVIEDTMENVMSDDVKDEKTEEQKNEETKKQEEKAEGKTEKVKEEKVEEKTEEKQEEKVEEKKEESAKSEEKSAESKPEKPTPSGKFKDLIKSIEKLSVLELAELVKELEERFGVSAAAPMMMAGAMPQGAGAAAGTEAVEEKAIYTIHLADAGAQKIAVIKVIREIRQDLGLKEAKDLVDGAPKDIKADVSKVEAEEAKKKLEAAGAKIELK